MTGVIKSINWVLFKTTSENRVNVYGLIEVGDAEIASGEAKGNKERHFLAKTAHLSCYFTVNHI